MKIILQLLVGIVVGLMGSAQARSLDTIRSLGTLGLCAHPNSLPFASKAGDPPGFQVELGQALARELGVSLRLGWIITVYQIRSADCDIVMDVIADREAQSETNLRISKPYYRTVSRSPCLRTANSRRSRALTSIPRSESRSDPWRR
jgi:polar amino acid transport system substrate-binding protein